MRQLLSRPYIPLLLILLIGLAVRLLGIANRPIWYDEAFSILFAEKGPQAMLYGTLAPTATGAADIHPIEYYSLLWIWIKALGTSLIATRLLSILIGICALGLIYLIGRELFVEKTGRIAALLAAISPFQVHFAQEIRMYALLCLWLLLATYAYLRGSREHSWRWWGLFALSAALAQYAHVLAAFFLIPLAATPLFRRDWRALRSTILSGIVSIILYLPWLVQLPSQIHQVTDSYWVEKPGISKLLTLMMVFTTDLPVPSALLASALSAALLLTSIAMLQTFRAPRGGQRFREANLWIFYLTFAPPLLLFIFSQWRPIYLERGLIASGMMFCIWLAWSLSESGAPRPIRYGMAAVFLGCSVLGILYHLIYSGFPYGPYRELAASLRGRLQPGEVILHSSKATMLPSVYYDPSLPQAYLADPPGSNIDTLADETQQVLGLRESPDLESATAGAGRVWFIVFQRTVDRYIELGYDTHPHLTWLNKHMQLVSVEEWGNLRLYSYTK